MQVRTNGSMGDRLFDWEPESNTIVIIKKKMVYRVKLFDEALAVSVGLTIEGGSADEQN